MAGDFTTVHYNRNFILYKSVHSNEVPLYIEQMNMDDGTTHLECNCNSSKLIISMNPVVSTVKEGGTEQAA